MSARKPTMVCSRLTLFLDALAQSILPFPRRAAPGAHIVCDLTSINFQKNWIAWRDAFFAIFFETVPALSIRVKRLPCSRSAVRAYPGLIFLAG
ncbi:hypothetical protein [Massilia rhizosphaerae]|uniref:hypothetical protein n=1 Tax=Massilia rhizosphaerae TaxID=2784389 RepID=UPI0018DD5431|nr:hypothetical protein [Massilia rhizosphaerae]